MKYYDMNGDGFIGNYSGGVYVLGKRPRTKMVKRFLSIMLWVCWALVIAILLSFILSERPFYNRDAIKLQQYFIAGPQDN